MMKNVSFEMRKKVVRKIIDTNQLDGILFTGLENIRYLCGFTGSDGASLITQKESFFLTDSRYWTQAEQEVHDCQIIHYKKKMEGIATLFLDLNLNHIGFESTSLAFSSYQFLLGRLVNEVKLIPLENELKNLRAIKEDQEITLIQKAIDISSHAFSHIMGFIKEGIQEREIALEMEYSMKCRGADNLGFDIIIASGHRSALPHGRASTKRIEKTDFILIDFGSGFQGYYSDQTRTLVCGNPSSEQEKIYQIVKEAHDRAIEAIRPGISICEIDRVARDHIQKQGYGDYFGHGLGHGIGLAVHEDPIINFENKDLIQQGMVFTIEPGIYLPDCGGVRIEDMVRVTSEGAEVLTYLPREIEAI